MRPLKTYHFPWWERLGTFNIIKRLSFIIETMKKFFLMLFLITSTAYSNQYFRFDYTIKNKDSFSKILKSFYKKGHHFSIKEKGIRETIHKNPHIRNWKMLPTGEIITLFVNEKFANEKKIKLNSLENERLKKNQKTFSEQKAYKNIEDQKDRHVFRTFYSNKSLEGKETEPSDIETPIKSFLGGGIEYFYYFNRTIYPLKLTSMFQYQSYRSVNILASTNPSRETKEISIPSTTTFNLKITKEKIWNQFSPYGSLERESLYNFEFNTSLDRNTLRKTTFIWGGAGIEYALPLKKMAVNLGVSLWTSLTTETELSDPIGNISFSESTAELNISAKKTKLTLEGIHKNYFLILGISTTKITGEKTLTFSEVFSSIGLYF